MKDAVHFGCSDTEILLNSIKSVMFLLYVYINDIIIGLIMFYVYINDVGLIISIVVIDVISPYIRVPAVILICPSWG